MENSLQVKLACSLPFPSQGGLGGGEVVGGVEFEALYGLPSLRLSTLKRNKYWYLKRVCEMKGQGVIV